ncbi:MAG: O-antigen ligase family protein [Clostridia bacterium]|nr:O-antigen ligase family protein [Clostridia bacterium]
MKDLSKKITIENALCLYIILCPILDMASFIFRNAFTTSISPSTFIRPIISIAVAIVIFFKCKFKRKNSYSWNCICYLWNNTFISF